MGAGISVQKLPTPGLITSILSLIKPTTKAQAAKVTRGLRNNNPGNIRHGPSHWVGQSETQTDNAFVQFDTMSHGVRALSKLLSNYQTNYGLTTIAAIINRWAPPTENNTSAYVTAVCGYFGKNVPPDRKVYFDTANDLDQMCMAIIAHENGLTLNQVTSPPLAGEIMDGVDMALGK